MLDVRCSEQKNQNNIHSWDDAAPDVCGLRSLSVFCVPEASRSVGRSVGNRIPRKKRRSRYTGNRANYLYIQDAPRIMLRIQWYTGKHIACMKVQRRPPPPHPLAPELRPQARMPGYCTYSIPCRTQRERSKEQRILDSLPLSSRHE